MTETWLMDFLLVILHYFSLVVMRSEKMMRRLVYWWDCEFQEPLQVMRLRWDVLSVEVKIGVASAWSMRVFGAWTMFACQKSPF